MARKKRQSPLTKLMKNNDDSHQPYETTVEDLQKWFRILNRELFDGELPDVDDIDIRWRRGNLAHYYCESDTDDAEYRLTRLCMNKRYGSERFMVTILAHEMVHHWQFMNGEPLGHGPSFENWCPKFAKKGMKLYRVYSDEK